MEKDLTKLFELNDLESFDPKAFEGDSVVPQDVCNFVLTLALIFNDLKDLLYANEYLQTIKPDGNFKITRKWGNYGGITNHLNRNLLGLIRETRKLIYSNPKTIKHPFFQSILGKLDKPSQKAWKRFVESSQVKPADSKVGKFLVDVRNQLIFHYNPESIYLGYKQFFSSGVKAAESAFISCGTNMAKTRYYFADAAVNGCFDISKEGYEGEDIFRDSLDSLKELNFAMMGIVYLFIVKRKYKIDKAQEEI